MGQPVGGNEGATYLRNNSNRRATLFSDTGVAALKASLGLAVLAKRGERKGAHLLMHHEEVS